MRMETIMASAILTVVNLLIYDNFIRNRLGVVA